MSGNLMYGKLSCFDICMMSSSTASTFPTIFCKCGVQAKLRTTKKLGPFKDKQFFGCSRFPFGCDFLEPVNHLINPTQSQSSTSIPLFGEGNTHAAMNEIMRKLYILEQMNYEIMSKLVKVEQVQCKLVNCIKAIVVIVILLFIWAMFAIQI